MKRLEFAASLAAVLMLATSPYAAQAQDLPAGPVEPEARQALDKMSAYLRTLQTFEVTTQTVLDLVTTSGQRIQLDGTANYKVRRPDGFVISVNTDWKKRTYYYDGKTITVFAPELGFYAQAGAPATIAQTLDVVADKYGITLPLEDLFRWNDPSQRTDDKLDTAMDVGPATIDGTLTEHYAFRQGMVDWEVWIEAGDRPLPRKLVIVDRTDVARPAYGARLTWTINPPLKGADFTFRPSASDKAIHIADIGNGR